MKRVLLGVLTCVLLAACGKFNNNGDGGTGGGSGGGTGGSGGGGSGGDQLTADEKDTTDRGGDSSNGVQQLTVLADSLFDFDPTVDTVKTALENAQAIEQNVRNNLGSTDGGFPLDGGAVGCGTVSLSGTTVTVAFGAAPGCTLRNGVKVSGTVAVTVTKTVNTIGLALTLTTMTVNGKSLTGTASFTTTTGTTFTLNADVTSGTTRYQAGSFTISGTTGTVTFNGNLSVTSGTTTTAMTFNAVTWKKGDCYPNGGTLRTVKGLIVSTITFNANTPTTGQVSVSTGRVTVNTYLPAYGSCGVLDGG